jgi:hypothetical protein
VVKTCVFAPFDDPKVAATCVFAAPERLEVVATCVFSHQNPREVGVRKAEELRLAGGCASWRLIPSAKPLIPKITLITYIVDCFPCWPWPILRKRPG